LDDLFPNRPKPPPTLYFFFSQVNAETIKAKVEEASKDQNAAKKFRIRSSIHKEMYDDMTEKETKKLTKKLEKAKRKYELDQQEFENNLSDEKRYQFER